MLYHNSSRHMTRIVTDIGLHITFIYTTLGYMCLRNMFVYFHVGVF